MPMGRLRMCSSSQARPRYVPNMLVTCRAELCGFDTAIKHILRYFKIRFLHPWLAPGGLAQLGER